jgi:hypothetical protein
MSERSDFDGDDEIFLRSENMNRANRGKRKSPGSSSSEGRPEPKRVTYEGMLRNLFGHAADQSHMDPDEGDSEYSFSARESEMGGNDFPGQDNVRDEDKHEKRKQYYGFKSSGFQKTNNITGDRIQPDPLEKEHIEQVLSKINSTNYVEQEEAKRTVGGVVNSTVKESLCRVCKYINTDVFSVCGSEVMSAMLAVQKFDLSTCGFVSPVNRYHELTQKFNELQVKRSSGRKVEVLFTTDEVAFCCRNHNMMNPKKVYEEGIHLARELKQECMMHVKGVTDDGKSIYNIPYARTVMFMQDKECQYVERLTQLHIALQQSGVLKSSGVIQEKSGKKGAMVDKSKTGIFKGANLT